MAEKRFRPVSCVTDWYIEDKKTSSFAVLTPHQASDLLNELHEENKKLKQVNEMLQMDFAITERNLMEENEQLKKENQELRQDNDIKFWKLQCIQSSNNNQIMLFELSRAIQQGYEVSDKFKQYSNEIKEHDKEIREKHKRLFE